MKHLFTPIPALPINFTTLTSWMMTTLFSCIMTTLTSCIMTTTVQEIEETVTLHQEHYTSKATILQEGLLAIQIQNNAENTLLQMDSMEICNIQLMDPAGELMHNGSPAHTGSIMFINNTLQLHYGTDTTCCQGTSTFHQGTTAYCQDTTTYCQGSTISHLGTTAYCQDTTTYCQGTSTEVKIPAQTLTPWNPAQLPTGSKNTYAKIHGTMYTYIADNTLFPIYTGTMYYPLSGTIPAATTEITAVASTDTSTLHPTPITITLQPNCHLYAIINGQLEKVLQPITFTVTVEDWE